MSIASAVSVVVHVISFLLLASLLSSKAEPELDNVLPVLHYQLGQFDEGDTPSETVANSEPTTARDQKASRVQTKDLSKPVAKSANKTSGTREDNSVPDEQIHRQADKQVAKAAKQSVIEVEEAVAMDLSALTTTAWSDQKASKANPDTPVLETVAMSPKQEKMFNKKIKQWTENFYKMDAADGTVAWEHKGQDYKATFSQIPAKNDTSIDQVMVEISTEENGRRLSTEMQMRRLAFSNFAQFVNRWDPKVQIHNDELDGRFHANSEISLGYSRRVRPTFHGKVTTSSRRVNFGNTRGALRRDKMFLGGLETGVRRIQLPKRYLVFPIDNSIDDNQMHQLDGDTRITFYADGTYGTAPADEPWLEELRPISGVATYIIGAPKSKLFVSGVVNGKILVYSPERIIIEGHVLYAHDPIATPDGDDYLGLVSDKNVEIAHPDITGPGDLKIYASIYAKRRFSVKHYRVREDSLLYIYGSLTAGSISATEPRYYTKIEFDKRLEKLRAPGFPVTNRYELTAWDGQWRVD